MRSMRIMIVNRVYVPKPGLTKFLGPIEASVMVAVWSGAQSATEVYKKVLEEAGKDYSFNTILTVIRRLCLTKKLLSRIRVGQKDLYSPVYATEAEFIACCIKEILESLAEDYSPELQQVLSSFVYPQEEVQ